MKEMEFKKVREDIIEYIQKNKVSTTEVADCLNKSGSLPGVKAVNRRHFCAGPIKWVYAYNESNWPVHEQVRDVQKGDIVFIEAFNCGDRAIIGELVAKYILVYRQASAIISTAKFRDINDIIKENHPIWCTGFNPEGCFNVKPEEELPKEIRESHFEKYNGAIAVCDDTGVVIVPKEKITPEFLGKLENIEEQEDIWFECLDHRKWDTFDIVCRKRYLNE